MKDDIQNWRKFLNQNNSTDEPKVNLLEFQIPHNKLTLEDVPDPAKCEIVHMSAFALTFNAYNDQDFNQNIKKYLAEYIYDRKHKNSLRHLRGLLFFEQRAEHFVGPTDQKVYKIRLSNIVNDIRNLLMKKNTHHSKAKPPNEQIKKELYGIYTAIYKSSVSLNKKERMLNSIFGFEPWSWRVVGISKKAVLEFKKNNFKYKSATFQRDHYFQARYVTLRKMLNKLMNINDWWDWYWENDKTLLITKKEHNKKNYDVNKDIIPIDWTLGYFESGATMGFNYAKKREGKFLEKLAKEYKI